MGEGADVALARLQQLEDVREIQGLIHRYAWHVPRCEGAAVVALFADDGEFDSGGRISRGREELAAYFAVLPPNITIPLISNIIVDLQGDRATSTCKMYTPWVGDGPPLVGFYEDEFQRVDGRWRFSRRVYRVHERPAQGTAVPAGATK